jgi:hypothetical protein
MRISCVLITPFRTELRILQEDKTTVSAKLETRENTRGTQAMLCPCCGGSVVRSAHACGCGARFVGEPLDETPIKVQRLGPAMTSVALLTLVVIAALVATKWIAVAALLVMWSSWRAMRLARRDGEWYGGYKTAAATFSLTIAGSLVLATYGIAHIPQAFENYRIRQVAATQSSMYRVFGLLEDHRRTAGRGSYPNPQEYRKVMGESLPMDYWDSSIKYQPRPGALADSGISRTGIEARSFELRSAGPDGIVGTDDDIIMRDGIFFTNSEVKKQTAVQQLR